MTGGRYERGTHHRSRPQRRGVARAAAEFAGASQARLADGRARSWMLALRQGRYTDTVQIARRFGLTTRTSVGSCDSPILRPRLSRPLPKAGNPARLPSSCCCKVFRSPGPTSATHSDSCTRIRKATGSHIRSTDHNRVVGSSNPLRSTRQSHVRRDFLAAAEWPRIGGALIVDGPGREPFLAQR
jgi:hypothetical protein